MWGVPVLVFRVCAVQYLVCLVHSHNMGKQAFSVLAVQSPRFKEAVWHAHPGRASLHKRHVDIDVPLVVEDACPA